MICICVSLIVFVSFQEHYDNFFEDVFVECEDKYGQVVKIVENDGKSQKLTNQVEEMNVCDNLGDHLVINEFKDVH